jgi:tetratricopeptide (TPR) repeat protein
MSMYRRLLFTSCLLSLAVAGCGGGGPGSGPIATTETGQPITTAGGAQVSAAAHNHWREAIAMFERHETPQTPNDGWTPPNCQATIGKFNEANGAQGGRFTEAIYMMGVVSGRCGNDEQAQQYYQQALATNERYCGALVGVGLQDMRAGRTREARQRFERAIEHDNQCTAAYVNLAIIQRANANEAAEALNNLRRALAIESNYLPAFNQMALLYYDQAADNRQMLDLAEVVCRQAQLINGNYAPIYNTWGLINVRQGNIIAAAAKFRQAFELRANFFEALMNFGQLVLSYRGYEDAREAFGRAVELRPRNYDALLGLGAALRGLNQLDNAEQRYRAAIEVDGQRPEAYFNLGLLYQDYMGGQETQLNQAIAFYEQFVQRAAGDRYNDTRENVTRTCRRRPQSERPRRRTRSGRDRPRSEWVGNCTPGRIQQIRENIRLQNELRQMQEEIQRMQQQSGGTPAEAPPAEQPAPPAGGGGG